MEMYSARMLQRHEQVFDERPTAVPREQVAATLRAPTRGVDARTAQQRTKAFYRSSGLRWSAALD